MCLVIAFVAWRWHAGTWSITRNRPCATYLELIFSFPDISTLKHSIRVKRCWFYFWFHWHLKIQETMLSWGLGLKAFFLATSLLSRCFKKTTTRNNNNNCEPWNMGGRGEQRNGWKKSEISLHWIRSSRFGKVFYTTFSLEHLNDRCQVFNWHCLHANQTCSLTLI